MPRKSDEVEALAKVMWDAFRKSRKTCWSLKWSEIKDLPMTSKPYRAMARAAIAHLSKKRGAKRGK